MNDPKKIIEDLKTEIYALKTRLARIEDYLSSFPKVNFDEQDDVLIDHAKKIVKQYDRASASLLQRRLSIGYARAARILDLLEVQGVVGPSEGSNPREVLIKK